MHVRSAANFCTLPPFQESRHIFVAVREACRCFSALLNILAAADPYNVPVTVAFKVLPRGSHGLSALLPGFVGDILAFAAASIRNAVAGSYQLLREVLFLHSGKITIFVAFCAGADSGDVMGFILGLLAVLYTLSGTVCCRPARQKPEPKVRPSCACFTLLCTELLCVCLCLLTTTIVACCCVPWYAELRWQGR